MIGVYKITNTIDGKLYIGSTASGFDLRWANHRSTLRSGKHMNPHLQRAWNKYGESAFTFEILENVANPKDVLEREQYWINVYYGCGICYNTRFASTAPKVPSTAREDRSKKPRGSGLNKSLSLAEAYKVAEWFRENDVCIESALRVLWRMSPSEIAEKFRVNQTAVIEAAGRI